MSARNNRIIVIDDNPALHEAFQKILTRPKRDAHFDTVEAALFGSSPPPDLHDEFTVTSAPQGLDGIELVAAARTAGEPFALAFVDVRMPPGIDGIETTQRLWEIDPDLQVVICSAYSDYTWGDMAERLGTGDRWVILKKPFDNVEVLQLAHALTAKWTLLQQSRALVADLERKVLERTVELATALENLRRESAERERGEAERRLVDRKLEETQRLEGLGVLAGGVAHDFNNILTGILASASLATLDVPEGTDVHQHLRRIEENSRRAAGLCQQLLVYAGKGNVTTCALDVNELLRETLELLHVSVPRDAEFTVDLAADGPLVNGDAARLRQVFMNLVLNAAEALAGAPRRIRLSSGRVALDADALAGIAYRRDAQPGEFVFVEVSDTGSGMKPETLQRIFEPFFTTKFTGRGLGLCAVLGIVRSHGGALHVTSEVGVGTTFRVYLPTSEAAAGRGAPQAGEKNAAAGAGTVLVVDDEESVRMVAAFALKRHGFQVETAMDGIEALERAEATGGGYVGALLDMTMPRMDGPSTVAALRKLQPDLPVVLMSGHDHMDVARQINGMARVALLQKPFTVEELVRRTTEHFAATAQI
jgi:signal transduction histidine kinase